MTPKGTRKLILLAVSPLCVQTDPLLCVLCVHRYYHCDETGKTSWTLPDGAVESAALAPHAPSGSVSVATPAAARPSLIKPQQSKREAEFFREQNTAKDEADRLAAQQEATALAAMVPEQRARHEAERKAAKDHDVRKARMLRDQFAKGGYGSKTAKSKLAGRRRGGKKR